MVNTMVSRDMEMVRLVHQGHPLHPRMGLRRRHHRLHSPSPCPGLCTSARFGWECAIIVVMIFLSSLLYFNVYFLLCVGREGEWVAR